MHSQSFEICSQYFNPLIQDLDFHKKLERFTQFFMHLFLMIGSEIVWWGNCSLVQTLLSEPVRVLPGPLGWIHQFSSRFIFLREPQRERRRIANQSSPKAPATHDPTARLQVGHAPSSSRLSASHPAFHLTTFTQETDRPAPRQQNSPNAFERPPFVLHSSNQLCTAHLLPQLRLRGRIPSHLYANYFATWTKVITLSDGKPTGSLKSETEINKLPPPPNAEKMGMRAAPCLTDQLEPPFKSGAEASGW